MDALLNNQKPKPPSRLQEWPNAPAQRGLYYGVMDPVFKKEQLCVMSMQTWADFGTLVEGQKRTLKAQDKVIKDLTAANGALAAQLNDVKERLENLRSAYREMKRAQLSKDNPQLAEADKEPFIANGGSEPISYI